MRKSILTFIVLTYSIVFAQSPEITWEAVENYNQWGWNAVVMKNGLITLATMPAIGGRVMQYDLGILPTIMISPGEFGKTYIPAQKSSWHNFGGYKTWPSPQSIWPNTWPPPPTLDYGRYTLTDSLLTPDSVSLTITSPIEQWIATGIQFERTATIFPGTTRVRMDQTIINTGTTEKTWGMWSITQQIVNHTGKNDYQNFWAYFPLNPHSIYGSTGVSPERASTAWKGVVAPGVYGVQFVASNTKIFADPNKGWIAYANLADTLICARTFPVFEGEHYPDSARVTVYVSSAGSTSVPAYMEVEVKAPLVALAPNGGSYTFTEDWWSAKLLGPVLDVNSVGAVGAHLSYASQILSGRYGVFHEGTVKIMYATINGQYSLTGRDIAVTPLEEFRLSETISIPDSAKSISLQIYNTHNDLLGVLDSTGISELLALIDFNISARVSDFRLEPAYPNPFNGGTNVSFHTSVPITGSLKIFDVLGREIAVLASGQFSAGVHRFSWNPETLSTGIYIARFASLKVHQTQKLIYLR